MAEQKNIESAASKSIRPFRCSEDYLYAMKEDLAEWLNALYGRDVQADTFMEALETGCALCQHANHVNQTALDFERTCPEAARGVKVPRNGVTFATKNVAPGSFVARDNVSNFIGWCRRDLGVQDVLMFETNDLVLRKNEKNFVLCLLEVARRGSKFGMLVPTLIQMEEEIEEEIRDALEEQEEEEAFRPRAQARRLCDFKNLDAMVREILGQCSCPSQFPMTKVSEGKYKVGETSTLIFIRVLRNHVMVRVGGGWDTLEHYLNKHDPCRCASATHRHQSMKPSPKTSLSNSPLASRAPSPGPHRYSESMSVSRIPDGSRHVDKRTNSAVELSTAKQNGLSAPTWDRPFIPTNGGSKSETTRQQSTPANAVGAAELMSKRFTQLPDPVYTGRTTSSRSYDSSEPRLSGSGRRREMSIPRRQAGEREHTAMKTGAQKSQFPPRKMASDDVLMIERIGGQHIVQRPRAQHDPNPRTLPMRRRSQSSEQRSPRKQHGENEGPGRKPSTESPRLGRSRLSREASRSSPLPIKGKAQYWAPSLLRGNETYAVEAGQGMPRTKSPSTTSSPQAASTLLKCPTPSVTKTRASMIPASSSGPAAKACSTRAPQSSSRIGHITHHILCYDQNQNVVNVCVDSHGRPSSPGGCPPSSPGGCPPSSPGCCDTSGCSPTLETEILPPAPSVHSIREDEWYRSFGEESLTNTKQVPLESNDTEASETQPTIEAERETPTAAALAPSNGATVNAEEALTSPRPERTNSPVLGCGRGGRTWNGGNLDTRVNHVLKTIENVREPVLPSPLSETQLYTVGSHCGSIPPGRPEEKVGNGQVSDGSAGDRTPPPHQGHDNSVESSNESINLTAVQMRPRKGLKKPDRVPSIYKLKLRPKIRPRTDNRPEKRPSKIPTPVHCRQGDTSPRSPQKSRLDGTHSWRKVKHKLILRGEDLQDSRVDLPLHPALRVRAPQP